MLRIALPAGDLKEPTLKFFEKAGLTEGEGIKDPRIEKIEFLRAAEIPCYLGYGKFDLGIVGADLIEEQRVEVEKICELLYASRTRGKVKVVLAIPQSSEINDSKRIKPGSLIATRFPNLTERYFAQLGIPVHICPAYPPDTEKRVSGGLADACVEVTETGGAIRREGLKIIDTILESTTLLIANKDSYRDSKKRKAIEEIGAFLQGALAETQ